MKFEIMLKILFELLSKKSVSANYLADKYQVSRRTIYRYMESLELAGVPIYTNRGQTGGFSIIDTYKLNSTFMTVEEFTQVINILTSFNENLSDKRITSAINKLKSTIKNEYSGFKIDCGSIIIDGGSWGDTNGYKTKLNLVHKCIEDCTQLSISYHDRNGKVSKRIIDPYFILFKQGLWYVYAFCNLRKTFRIFKIGRIESANLLDSKFIKKQIDNDNLSLDFFSDDRAEHVEMEIDSKILSDIEEWLGVENIYKEKGKNFARATLPYDSGLISKIMSFGSGIKVLSPKKLVEEIKANANEILRNY